MKRFKKIVARLIVVATVLYVLMLCLLYFNQEKLLFHPEVLASDFAFQFDGRHEEIQIPVSNKVKLHGLLFRTDKSKGLVFYLHGNGGSVKGWGNAAALYTEQGYDIFILDYRGYGKSGGHIESEAQILSDVVKAYDFMSAHYKESNIIIAGYSIGTGLAVRLASEKKCKALLLQAPYNSLSQLISEKVPLIPEFIKRYKLESCNYIGKVKAPVFIFHGTADKLIPFHHAEELIKKAKNGDVLIPLPGQGHNAINDSELYKDKLIEVLGSI